jgi:hypothetical protein
MRSPHGGGGKRSSFAFAPPPPAPPLVDLASTPADAPSPYVTVLESALLAATAAYYASASRAWLAELSGSGYVARVEATLAAEDERVTGWSVHTSTAPALSALLTDALIREHVDALIEKDDGTGLGAVLAAGRAATATSSSSGADSLAIAAAAAGAGAGAGTSTAAGGGDGGGAAAAAPPNRHLQAVATFYRVLRRLGEPGRERFAAAVRRHVLDTGAALAVQREARYATKRADALARMGGGGGGGAAGDASENAAGNDTGAGAGSSSSSSSSAAAVVRKRARHVPLDADDPAYVAGLVDLVAWVDAVEATASDRDPRVSRAKCAGLADVVNRRLFADGDAQQAECPSTVQSLVVSGWWGGAATEGAASRR